MRTLTRLGIGVLLVGAMVSCGSDGPDTGSADANKAPSGETAESGGDASTAAVIDFTATEFEFDPSTVVAEAGPHTGTLTNDGSIEHDITFENGETFVVEPGESVDITFDVPEGGLAFHCSIPGHEEAGMHGRIDTA